VGVQEVRWGKGGTERAGDFIIFSPYRKGKDHCLVFAEDRKRLTVNKQEAKNLNDNEDINKAWENIKENISTSAKDSRGLYDLKQHKAWFDEDCLCF
jgi:hypothetical protein